MVRLAMIGCGRIADFHVPALREAGFDIVSVASRNGSVRLMEFAKRHGIKNVFSSSLELLDSHQKWDALLIVTPTDVAVDYIKLAAPLGKPILVEKPVALDHKELEPILGYKNIRVAYNRRFYESVEYAKEFITSRDKVLLKISIPEQRKDPEHNQDFPQRLPALSYENSVHQYDLMHYLAGGVTWHAAKSIRDSDKYVTIAALGESNRGNLVQLDTCFNAPDNFAISIITNDERVDLRPIEIARHYKGMRISEPTVDTPIRVYSPNQIAQAFTQGVGGFKPGFIEQAKEYYEFCLNGKYSKSASLSDAYKALKSIHSISKLLLS